MSEEKRLNVVTISESNDVVQQLRNLADSIERGVYGKPVSIISVGKFAGDNGPQIQVFGGGLPEADGVRAVGLLQLGMKRLFDCLQ